MTNQVDLSSIVSREFPAVAFVNPAAGGGRAGAYLPRIRKFFETHALPTQIISTSRTEELEARARECIVSGHRLLLAVGGDGTFQGLANAAFGSDILISILPTGGGNDFAAALGLPENPIAAAEAILRGRPRWVDLVRVRTADGRERLYVGGGGVGLDADAAECVSRLIRNHLLMSRTSQLRDLTLPQTIRDFVAVIDRPDLLELERPAVEPLE